MMPALANHLWQSTVFAFAAALLTLVLRRNAARYRYWVWMAASVKLLIPLSVLMSVGGQLAQKNTSATLTQPSSYYAMDVASQPFTFPPVVTPAVLSAKGTTYVDRVMRSLPAAPYPVWMAGAAVVLMLWWKRWRSVAATLREAPEAVEGREFEVLHRLRPEGVRLAISEEALEPGIFGIFQPVLVWPRAFSEHLDDAQMEAILAHEICHVRRRDNLAAALHMVVEAVFWFHPMVWWLGTRLIEERERACDEAVVELGNQPRVYAESILKACTFCVESSLACVAGITGARLKARIVRIMTDGVADSLSMSRRVFFAVAGVIVVAGPILFGFLDAPRVRAELPQAVPGVALPSFAVASVKANKLDTNHFRFAFTPDGVHIENATLLMIIRGAYGAFNSLDNEFVGVPGWAKTEKFDIDAKVDASDLTAYGKLAIDQRRLMMQALLADRFKLRARREAREQPVLALVVTKGGVKFRESTTVPTYPTPALEFGHGHLAGVGTMSELVSALTQSVGRTVVDRTGLSGRYDFTLDWTPDRDTSAEETAPPLYTALAEQLGLKLEPQKGLVDVLVIEAVQRPTQN